MLRLNAFSLFFTCHSVHSKRQNTEEDELSSLVSSYNLLLTDYQFKSCGVCLKRVKSDHSDSRYTTSRIKTDLCCNPCNFNTGDFVNCVDAAGLSIKREKVDEDLEVPYVSFQHGSSNLQSDGHNLAPTHALNEVISNSEVHSSKSEHEKPDVDFQTQLDLRNYYTKLVSIGNDFPDSTNDAASRLSMKAFLYKNKLVFKHKRNSNRKIYFGIVTKKNISDYFLSSSKKEPLDSQRAIQYCSDRSTEYKERLYYRFNFLFLCNNDTKFKTAEYKMALKNNKSTNILALNTKNEYLPTVSEYDFITGCVFSCDYLKLRYELFVNAYKATKFYVTYATKLFRAIPIELHEEILYSSTQINDCDLSAELKSDVNYHNLYYFRTNNNEGDVSMITTNLMLNFFHLIIRILQRTFIEKQMNIKHSCFKAFIVIFNIVSIEKIIHCSEIDPKTQSAILFYLYRDINVFYESVNMNEIENYIEHKVKRVFINQPKGLNLKIVTRIIQNLLLFSEIFFCEETKKMCVDYMNIDFRKKVMVQLILYEQRLLNADEAKRDGMVLELLGEIYAVVNKK